MGRLIVDHGERVAEFEIGDAPVVIGRDPDCELFFPDRKLSRQHARIEPQGDRFKLVDLDSRNGCWVNGERVVERYLVNGDEIRLGGLHIRFEQEIAPRPEEDPTERGDEEDPSTVYLAGGAEEDSNGTVILGAGEVSPRPETPRLEGEEPALDDSATRAVSRKQPDLEEADETLRRGEAPDGPEQTVVLAGERPRRVGDTGSVLFRARVDPRIESAMRAASQEELREPGPPGDRRGMVPESSGTRIDEDARAGESAAEGTRASSGAPGYLARLAALVVLTVLFAIAVLALPLMRVSADALAEESLLRGRALARLLAATNETALGQSRFADASSSRVAAEPGVTGAFVLDTAGRIVVPAERAGEPLELEGLGALGEVRTPRTARTEAGELVVAEPVSYRGRRVGIAVLRLRTPGGGWPLLVLLLGSTLLATGLATAVLLTKRLTLAPVKDLRRDVDVMAETSSRLSTERPFLELSELARSVNRLAEDARD